MNQVTVSIIYIFYVEILWNHYCSWGSIFGDLVGYPNSMIHVSTKAEQINESYFIKMQQTSNMKIRHHKPTKF